MKYMNREVSNSQEGEKEKKPQEKMLGEISLEALFAERSNEYREKLRNGIKVVIGGPLHSGKSVFFNSLRQALPFEYPLSAVPDGEGSWFQGAYAINPVIAKNYRKKGEYTSEIREEYQRRISNCKSPLMMIDIGGRITPDKIPMIKDATHAIILSSDLSKVSEWRDFFEGNNIRVIGVVHSHYDGLSDRILPNDGTRSEFKGSVHHLERGESAVDRETIQSMASIIKNLVENNKYYEGETDNSLIMHVDQEFSGLPKDERYRTLPRAIPMIYEKVSKQNRKSVWLDGVRCSWETVAFALAFEENGADDIRVRFYDSFIPVKKLPEDNSVDEKWWGRPEYKGEVDGKSVYVIYNKANQSTNLIRPSDLETLTVPAVPDNSIVIISGAGPNWLKASIASGYRGNVEAIAVFQPGIGSTIAWSKDKRYLGDVIRGNV